MEKILISQTFKCTAEVDGVTVTASRVSMEDGKVVRIEQGYFNPTGREDYKSPEPHFSVYRESGKLKVRTDAELQVNPCTLVNKFIAQIEAV